MPFIQCTVTHSHNIIINSWLYCLLYLTLLTTCVEKMNTRTLCEYVKLSKQKTIIIYAFGRSSSLFLFPSLSHTFLKFSHLWAVNTCSSMEIFSITCSTKICSDRTKSILLFCLLLKHMVKQPCMRVSIIVSSFQCCTETLPSLNVHIFFQWVGKHRIHKHWDEW